MSDRRDEGAVLPLVLVMTVIGALVILPLMSYAVAVARANNVVTDNTRNMEAVRAGARIAMADPLELFERCQTSASVAIPMPSLDEPVSTRCRQIGEVGIIEDVEIPYGAVAIQLGETVPPTFRGTTCFESAPCAVTGDGTELWWDAFDQPLPVQDTIWLPNLPERVSYLPEADGYAMPATFGQCRVFFPGTYDTPIVLSDTTYFASGDYYFLDTVTVVGGADVVGGYGIHEGCADDIQVVLDLEDTPPGQYNISGGGATWVFGGEARLIIDNELTVDAAGDLVDNTGGLPIRFVMNQRYVENFDDPNTRVSIATVNGDIDAVEGPPVEAGPLVVPGVVEMPVSTVTTASGPVDAIEHGYLPSVHTAEPRPPAPPEGFTLTPFRNPADLPGFKGAVELSWDEADDTTAGGSTVTRYVVVDPSTYIEGVTDPDDVKVCETDGRTSCWLTGLEQGAPGYEFAVLAYNDLGWSELSDPDAATPLTSHQPITVPGAPQDVEFDEYQDAVVVRWHEPSDDGVATITEYTATAYEVTTTVASPLVETRTPVGSCTTTVFRDEPAPTSCTIGGLPPITFDPLVVLEQGYRFGVTATNVVGTGPESDLTDPVVSSFVGDPAPPDPVPEVPIAGPYVPPPVVDIDVSGLAAVSVELAGYTAVPQGRVRVENPNLHEVAVRGGVVAGSFDVDEVTAGDPSTTVGFTNTVLQRTLQITSTSVGKATSVMTVQINESGAYEVNSWVIQ